ncbi:MAG: phosphate propanoyltransferase [Elusimicrobiota bacterium]
MVNEKRLILANISNRHMHLSQQDLEILFGKGAVLTNIRDLVQPGQFAAKEKVNLVGSKRELKDVRVVGPVRSKTQVEISKTEAISIGVNPPVRESGDLNGSAKIKLVGPKGEVVINEGCVIAKRHVHFTPVDAEKFGIKDKQLVWVKAGIGTGRETIFADVVCRVRSDMALECHIDTDEANGCGLVNGDKVELITKLECKE